jgi:hypothetical protein
LCALATAGSKPLPLDKYIGNSFCAIQHNNNVDANLLIATVLRIKFVYWIADIRGIRNADALATPLFHLT